LNMSPPKANSARQMVAQSAFAWLDENTPPLAAEITSSHFAAHPELLQRYGPQGKTRCREDAEYHLHYLSEAVAASSPQVFADYAAWAKIMLAARGIDWRDLAENFHLMAQVLERNAPAEHNALFAGLIGSAIHALPTLPDRVPAFINPAAPLAALANSYLESLLLLDRDRAISMVLKETAAGLSVSNLFHHVIYPVQQEVGRLWQENKITVLQEHYCTAATELLVASVKGELIGRRREVRALALCPEDEEHCLGMKMFAELLHADGWTVAYIGARVPTRDVLKHLKTNKTDLVAVSAATALNLNKTRRLIAAIRELSPKAGPPILVGGSALKSDANLWKTLGADAFGSDLLDGLDAANRLVNTASDD
jgi:methanogenic corrinoid protein MtbC1